MPLPICPSIELLTKWELDLIYASSLRILEEIGVAVNEKSALKLLGDAGARVDRRTNLVSIPENLVAEALAKAPKGVRLFSRDHKETLSLEEGNVYYSPGSTTPFIVDRIGTVRKPVGADLVNLVRLVDALENIQLQSTALVVSDVPDSIADLYRLFLVLKNSTKPVMTGAFHLDGLLNMKRMLQAVSGGEDELRRRPIAVFCACPTSPLTWGELGVQTLIQCGNAGIPVEIVAAPQLGVTGPATIAGSLAQLNSEFLCGLVISQLARPGASVIYGGAPATFDMRYCTPRTGAVESMMLISGYAQMGKHYGLPTSAYTGDTDAKTIDAQAGFESGFGIALATLAGVNIISGPGGLNFLSTQSLEKLVIDDAICGMARRLRSGIVVSEETIALNAIRKAGPGGQYLGLKHTLDWATKEQFMPSQVVDRQSPDAWKAKGSWDSVANAAAVVEKLLREHKPEPLPPDMESLLDAIVHEVTGPAIQS